MTILIAKKLYDDICNTLLNPDFLNQYSLNYDKMKRQVQSPYFIQHIRNIAENNDYSCNAVFLLCKEILDELWGDDYPVNPLYYIYQFTLSFSFPHSVEIVFNKKWDKGCFVYLNTLRRVCHYQKQSPDGTWQSKYPLQFLNSDEVKSVHADEYQRFVNAFEDEYIYEMMKLNQEIIGHNTLDHICCVHHLAIFIGKQLIQAGIPVDLERVSGASAGHDIGKYGCRSFESKRVPYLHYYYTDLWFKRHHITYIGHIALNHSVWDLELENLSIESLILIYCDFRVKNAPVEENKMQMKILTLKEAFKVILNKLDNVDEKKQKRYTRVYIKLKDFEKYMMDLKINLTIDEISPEEKNTDIVKNQKKYYSLMHGKEITENIKFLSINHNIYLMHKLRDETSLNEILEIARSQEDAKLLSEYLNIFEEYSTHLTQKQKIITLKFLYENLIHPEEDIRKQCSVLMGKLIGTFDEDYRKEIPEDVTLNPPEITSSQLLDNYLRLFVTPDHKIIPLHRSWISYSIGPMIASLFSSCKNNQISEYKEILLKYYSSELLEHSDMSIHLLEAIRYIPLYPDDSSLHPLFDYILHGVHSQSSDVRISALETIFFFIDFVPKNSAMYTEIRKIVEEKIEISEIPAENFLKLKIARKLELEKAVITRYEEFYQLDTFKASDIFLSNLKSATNWVTKKNHVELLLNHCLENSKINGLYTAMHFCNLLKVSAIENVRIRAGEALVKLFPYLPIEQRNDIAIELLRALEIEGYQFTKYIPNYLGQIMIYLQPYEIDEIIEDLIEKIKHSNWQINMLLLKTIGIFVSNYPKYKTIFYEEETDYQNRLKKILGILLNGLVHFDQQIQQISFNVVGREIFGSKILCLEEKYHIFQIIAKKILTLLQDIEENELLFLMNSASLNHIYRFISDYHFFNSTIHIPIPKKVAFFPGTFDPFTLSHKEIVKAIRNIGFEVYLAVDEFSWSKRTQPNLIRKNIMNMSVADEINVYLYPEDFPVNIANPNNLKELIENFSGIQVYIVVGSDVILNASAYQGEETQYSIHHFPHIIFDRRTISHHPLNDECLAKSITKIRRPVIRLNLPPQYEDISSTQIRNYIDENRDISKLIDPLAQKCIYKNNLYRKEPQYKSMMQTISIDVDVIDHLNPEIIDEIISSFHKDRWECLHSIQAILCKPYGRLILLRDVNQKGKILAYSAIHSIPSGEIYQEFQDSDISDYIRTNYTGRIILIDGIFTINSSPFDNLYQIILTETLIYCIKNDFGYTIFHNRICNPSPPELIEILKLHGFIDLSYANIQDPVLTVDITYPCTLNLDVDTFIKEPFKSSENVRKTIVKTRKKLQKALTQLYPGSLVLSFDRSIIDETLAKKICSENGVPPVPLDPRQLGPYMCVPFGNILNRAIVPNTITKSLHTEKMFAPDMKSFKIGAFPYYLDLENQVKMIQSFNKPVILVDDLLNKGYRIKALDPLLKKHQIPVKKIIVGILSGRGKELMERQDREVDCAYFIPRLRHWFNENLQYPFIGGDMLWRGVYPESNLLPSICLILPYTSPSYIKGVTNKETFNLSQICIENAIDILEALELEYQKINERKLTLSLLGEVFLYPRCPDHGKDMYFDLNLNASGYLKNDLELLKRLANSICES